MAETWTQLVIGSPYIISGPPRTGRPPPPAQLPDREVSSHLVGSGQRPLFDVRRDWPVLALRRDELPAPTDSAQQLLDTLDRKAREEHWSDGPREEAVRTLRILASWLGADMPFYEADIHDLARLGFSLSAKRVSQFLEVNGLLIPDPLLRRDKDKHYVEEAIQRYPAPIAAELHLWVKVLRGEGRRQHRQRGYFSIRRYLDVIVPILNTWTEQVSSLRGITRKQIQAAIQTRQGNPARAIHVVLRSLFRALRQERAIFHDPTRGLTFSAVKILPPTISSDLLAGLIDQARTPADKLVVALVGIHALTGTDLKNLQTTDLDLSAGQLRVQRSNGPHTVHLDALTHQLAADWLAHRHRIWPSSTNPHLLLTRRTTMDIRHPPVNGAVFNYTFSKRGLTMQQVRQDRIHDEARETADPIHLMRLFGIGSGTAMKYIAATHPERTSKLPR